MPEVEARNVPAIKVRQWLSDWNKIEFDTKLHRRKPPEHFYLFSLNARDLKILAGIQRRVRQTPGAVELGIQRRHDASRSQEIAEFVRHGFPWSEMSEAKRASGRYDDLRKPGWLPTALVVNILTNEDHGRGKLVSEEDRVLVTENSNGLASITLPVNLKHGWKPTGGFPIDVIDGQHRLWAFEDNQIGDDFELPVVAFYGLDISWQAYLFWTINIKPKKINTSLAFDLYPLLRSEDWLEKFEGHSIYRETRSQELVERLWSSTESPWFQRINMLGEAGVSYISQAAWIRALTATYVRTFEARKGSVGGLFGAPQGQDELVLPWSRAQQAGFLIFLWREMKRAVWDCDENWADSCRADSNKGLDFMDEDPAFYGEYSLLNQDQGIRTFLHVTNDIIWASYTDFDLADWEVNDLSEDDDSVVFKTLIEEVELQPISAFVKDACESLAVFDWRSARHPKLNSSERQEKLVFRGSGGYKEFRIQLLKHVARFEGPAGEAATKVLEQISI